MTRITFESDACGRCGGTGTLRGFSHIQGGVCFGCSGSGKHLTRAGRRALDKFQAWAGATLDKPVAEVTVGERICVPAQFAAGALVRLKGAREVLEIDAANPARVRVAYRGRGIAGWLEPERDEQGNAHSLWVALDPTVRRLATADELRAIAPTLGKGATLVDQPVAATEV